MLKKVAINLTYTPSGGTYLHAFHLLKSLATKDSTNSFIIITKKKNQSLLESVEDYIQDIPIYYSSISNRSNFFRVLWNNTLKDESDKDKFKSEYSNMNQFKFDHKDIKAFVILGISVGLKWQKIQEKFKILVKKFHPDINAGNKKYDEKLKQITLAYTQLKNTYREKIDTKS